MLFGMILIVGAAVALFLGAKALSGPSASKAVKRRLEMLKERHGDGVLAANAQAQIRKLMAQRAEPRRRHRLDPDPASPALLRKRLEQTGKQISLAKYGMISVGLGVVVMALLLFKGAPFLLAFFVGAFAGVGLPHFVIGKMIKRRIAKFTVQLPRRDRADGARPALGPSDHRDAGHRRRAKFQGPVGIEFRGVSRQDEDRPDDGGRAPGNRRPPRHARVPVLRHHAGDPARDRRQPCRDAVEPRRRAAQARPDEAQDPRDELGIEGLGLYRRLAAVHRLRARLHGQPATTSAASSPTSG